MTRLFVRSLEISTSHRRFVAQASLLVDEIAHETDKLDDTIDYREVKAVIAAVALNEPYVTMERLSRQICQTLLMRFPTARRVDLEIVDEADAGIECFLERSR